MLDKEQILNDIFDNDPLNILDVKLKSSTARNSDERLISSFEEINTFYEANDKEPEPNMSNISEYQLYQRLKSLRDNPEKMNELEPYDKFKLLDYQKKEINSIDDIFDDDSFGLLGDDSEGLFDFKHTPKEDTRASADFVAKRKPCKDFDKYEDRLKQVQKDLATGKRRLIEFKEGNIRAGEYYIHNGVLFLLESIDITKKEHYKPDGTRVREDGRTRCIFENGTESNLLKRSVEKNLYKNGKVVTMNSDDVVEDFIENTSEITDEDTESGYIYVLKSNSNDEQIKSIPNLFKIGYSKYPVESRINNAENEPTYLMSSVSVIGEWKCYNMNPQKFEQLLHNFFGEVCIELDVYDKKGKRHTPREWFTVPITIIEETIELIISNKILDYTYDADKLELICRI
ncbi:GIY-YIG nuclease family protein [Candidatus Kapabacteria bacterium]|nr:GIY-YIG nuclease family protein [Candidatus Kapabacteria bacterium]